jgi:hypothetical protein
MNQGKREFSFVKIFAEAFLTSILRRNQSLSSQTNGKIFTYLLGQVLIVVSDLKIFAKLTGQGLK